MWDDGTERIIVPENTPTDLASIPRIMRAMLQQNGLSRRPAVLHDYLYRQGIVPRSEADAIFRRALASEGMIAPVRFTYWAGVRLGGWMCWQARRED